MGSDSGPGILDPEREELVVVHGSHTVLLRAALL
jgi:hypothetical protein